MNKQQIEKGVKEILLGLGEDPSREGLLRTPERVARLYSNLFIGYGEEPKITKFTNKKKINDILARKCDFISFCEHHIVPFAGIVYVAYIPEKYLIGLDKIDLAVDYFAGRLRLQEEFVHDLADFLMKTMEPKGVVVQGYAIHYCALCKGNTGGGFGNSAVRGVFTERWELELKAMEMFKRLDELERGK